MAQLNDIQVRIRQAELRDAQRIAILSGQLGYPTTQEKVRRRLQAILHEREDAIFVAELQSGHVVGWTHAHVCRLLVEDPQVMLGGLVVDEAYRRSGVGRLLMEHVEQWARQQGCWAVSLRSNVARKDVHLFYEAIGYEQRKTSRVLRKIL